MPVEDVELGVAERVDDAADVVQRQPVAVRVDCFIGREREREREREKARRRTPDTADAPPAHDALRIPRHANLGASEMTSGALATLYCCVSKLKRMACESVCRPM